MSGYAAKILNNASGALRAHQAQIAVTGNNIANVDTPGYSKRTVSLESRSVSSAGLGSAIGNGVDLGNIIRQGDEYVEKMLREATSSLQGSNVEKGYLEQLQSLFDLTGQRPTVGSTITEFFSAVNDLRLNPSSIDLRATLIERGRNLVTTIKDTYTEIARMQDEANARLSDEINSVNDIASNIASLNQQITSKEKTGVTAADERDKRDILLQKLAEKIEFSTTTLDDGGLLISLENGFPLINGSSVKPLEVTTSPSFSSGNLPESLSGKTLSYVVYDYDPGPGAAHVDLTSVLASGNGVVGGLLKVRGTNAAANTSPFQATGTLVAVASRIEAITRTLLTSVNTTYLGPDETAGGVHDPSSRDLNGNPPGVYGLFDFAFSGTKDSNGNGLPDDLNAAALGISTYSSILSFGVSDPRAIAAALDDDATAGSVVTQAGNGRNLDAIFALRDSSITHAAGTFSGAYALTGTFNDVYNDTVTYVGNAVSTANVNQSVATTNYNSMKARREEIAGVSLDEEFTSLVSQQKAYQAAARMVRVAETLLDEIIRLI